MLYVPLAVEAYGAWKHRTPVNVWPAGSPLNHAQGGYTNLYGCSDMTLVKVKSRVELLDLQCS